MSAGLDSRQRRRVALGHRREVDLTVGQLRFGVVLPFDVRPLEARELDDSARGTELDRARHAADVGRAGQADLGARSGGVGHLGGDRPLPNEVVELELVSGQRPGGLVRGAEGLPRRPDGLVRLLGVLDLLVVEPGSRRDIGRSVHGGGLGPGCGQRLVRQRRRVCPHIGDPASLVEGLSHRHGALGAEPELASGLLLKGRGDERRTGRAPKRLVGHRRHHQAGTIEPSGQGSRFILVQHHHAVRVGQPTRGVEVLAGGQRCAVDRHQSGSKGPRHVRFGGPGGLSVCGHLGIDPPPVGRTEGHPLAFPIDHHPGGDALDPAGRTTVRLAAHDVRKLEPVDAVEDPAGLLGLDQVGVDGPALVDRPLDGLGGDLVKDHPGSVFGESQDLAEVPGDRLPFAVLVRSQEDFVCVAGQPLEGGYLGLLLGRDDVDGLEPIVDIDGEVRPRLVFEGLWEVLTRGQVPDVPDRGFDHVVRAQEPADGLGLGRRLDDHQLLAATGPARGASGGGDTIVGVGFEDRLSQVGWWHRCGKG